MKLYTEEQVREGLTRFFDSSRIWTHDDIIKSLTPIELPTDEEIKNKMFRFNITDFGQMAAFQVGAKYVIEQIQEGKK